VTKDSRIEICNTKAAAIFKFESTELVGADVNILVPSEYRKSHSEHITKYFKRKNTQF